MLMFFTPKNAISCGAFPSRNLDVVVCAPLSCPPESTYKLDPFRPDLFDYSWRILACQNHFRAAHAKPSAPAPALINFWTLKFSTSMAATCLLASHETYAIFPSGLTKTNCGVFGTSTVL